MEIKMSKWIYIREFLLSIVMLHVVIALAFYVVKYVRFLLAWLGNL